jgi:hypothetical protein
VEESGCLGPENAEGQFSQAHAELVLGTGKNPGICDRAATGDAYLGDDFFEVRISFFEVQDGRVITRSRRVANEAYNTVTVVWIFDALH